MIRITVSVNRKLGGAPGTYSSEGASVEFSKDLPDDVAIHHQDLDRVIRDALETCDALVTEQLGKHVDTPGPKPTAVPERDQLDRPAMKYVAPVPAANRAPDAQAVALVNRVASQNYAPKGGRPAGRSTEGPPTTPSQLLGWARKQPLPDGCNLTTHLGQWGKANQIGSMITAWPADAIADAHAEALRWMATLESQEVA
jgi:hypothetical protein